MFVPDGLARLIDDGVIDRVVRPLKSGKEADMFVVEKDDVPLAAKVYKARERRNFRNDAGYREGRRMRNSRSQRALDKNTKYGRQVAEQAWHKAEADALRTMKAAGGRVPELFAFHENVLIMELITDRHGEIAPQLAQVPLSATGARDMWDKLIGQVVLMLCNDLIHGDFSPYNVLVNEDGPVII